MTDACPESPLPAKMEEERQGGIMDGAQESPMEPLQTSLIAQIQEN